MNQLFHSLYDLSNKLSNDIKRLTQETEHYSSVIDNNLLELNQLEEELKHTQQMLNSIPNIKDLLEEYERVNNSGRTLADIVKEIEDNKEAGPSLRFKGADWASKNLKARRNYIKALRNKDRNE